MHVCVPIGHKARTTVHRKMALYAFIGVTTFTRATTAADNAKAQVQHASLLTVPIIIQINGPRSNIYYKILHRNYIK